MGLELLREAEGQAAEELKDWKAPAHAFVLFESRHFDVRERKWFTSLFPLNVEHRPEVGAKFDQYIQKGFRIIGFGNFPSLNDANGTRAAKAKLHSGPNGANPWDELKVKVRHYAKLSIESNAIKENSALKARLAELEAQSAKKADKNENRRDKEVGRS